MRTPSKLLFKLPTRGRPIWFLSTLHNWIGNLSEEYDCDFVICIDEDDEQMNNDKVRELVIQLGKYSPCVSVELQCGPSLGTVAAVNEGLSERDWDIIVPLADDLKPLVKDIDKRIAKDYVERYPDYDGVTYYYDGRHKPDVLTFPAVGRQFYNYRGFLLDPAFKYQGADRDLHYLADAMDQLSYVDGTQIYYHEHKRYGIDDTMKRARNRRMEDKNLVMARMRDGYYKKLKEKEND